MTNPQHVCGAFTVHATPPPLPFLLLFHWKNGMKNKKKKTETEETND